MNRGTPSRVEVTTPLRGTSHLRYETAQGHAHGSAHGPALQRRGTLMVPQLWSYARVMARVAIRSRSPTPTVVI
jgi:hypothetical protein